MLILEWSGPIIYAALAVAGLFGLFYAVLLLRKIAQKRFLTAAAGQQFLDDVRDRMTQRDFDGVVELCDSPPYWSKAVPQLILVAMANRERPIGKLRQLLAERFEREVLADLEYRLSWIGTVGKTAPMLGLLGTVTGMIMAFGKIALASQTGGMKPDQLANEISVALYTTAWGLTVAIPMTLLGSFVQVRIGKLADAVQDLTGEFLFDLEAAQKS